MKKVFLTEYIHPAAQAHLAAHAEIVSDYTRIPEVDGVITRNGVVVDHDFMMQAPNLKVVGVHGSGTDAVAVEEAQERGIQVFATPGLNSLSVAELNVELALNLLRKVSALQRIVYGGEAVGQTNDLAVGNELSGKIIGFIGSGNIAGRTAKILHYGFECPVIAWSPHLTEEKAAEFGMECRPNMETVLKEADIIFLCLPLKGETEGLIGEREIALCKKTALLINTSRGKIWDEAALCGALKERVIAGAAADAFVVEPVTVENPLLELPNFCMTPHIGASTDEALYRVGMAVVEGVLERLR